MYGLYASFPCAEPTNLPGSFPESGLSPSSFSQASSLPCHLVGDLLPLGSTSLCSTPLAPASTGGSTAQTPYLPISYTFATNFDAISTRHGVPSTRRRLTLTYHFFLFGPCYVSAPFVRPCVPPVFAPHLPHSVTPPYFVLHAVPYLLFPVSPHVRCSHPVSPRHDPCTFSYSFPPRMPVA